MRLVILTALFWFYVWMLSVYVGSRVAWFFSILWAALVLVATVVLALWPDNSAYVAYRLFFLFSAGLLLAENVVLYVKGGGLVRRGWFGDK